MIFGNGNRKQNIQKLNRYTENALNKLQENPGEELFVFRGEGSKHPIVVKKTEQGYLQFTQLDGQPMWVPVRGFKAPSGTRN